MRISEILELKIIFPNCQRDMIVEHSNEIYNFQKDYFSKYGMYLCLGCIEIARCNGKLYCIDGQHRYHAYLKLYSEDTLNNFNVDIEIIECADENEMIYYFKIINMNKPVPDFIKNYKSLVATDLKNHIMRVYPHYVKESERPIRPNINLTRFLNELQKHYGTIIETFRSSSEIIDWFENMNIEHRDFLKSRDDDIVVGIIKKIEDNQGKLRNSAKFYLGCYWLDSIPKKISATTRKIVWRNFYDSLVDKDINNILCPCCESVFINPFEFDCGHIISYKNGGMTCVDNLRPICSGCNSSMGAMNWNDFITRL
jgi:hypothetical protein